MFKFGDWINRKRHNRGFGIQSPSAFFFITQILREKLPYYAYEKLDSIAENCQELSVRRCRTLFRIANDLAPTNATIIASATAACAISSANRNTSKQFITEQAEIPHEAAKHLAECHCSHISGNTLTLFKESLKAHKSLGLLYIGKCHNQQELLHTALQCANKESIIIVEGINQSKQHRQWWEQIISNPKTIVTYDMHSMGILFFDHDKQKQNYTLKR